MPDDVARAVGAGGRTITIAGKECQIRPLGLRELTEVERDCLEQFKRTYLKTFESNLDLLPEQERMGLMIKKFEEVARWDVDNLPSKHAHDQLDVQLTDQLKAWLKAHWGLGDNEMDDRLRRMAAASLDQETLSAETYQRLTGSPPSRVKVPYVHWWITGSFDGMVSMIWTCFRRYGVTKEQVIEEVGGNLVKLNEMARDIEQLSAPAAGNG